MVDWIKTLPEAEQHAYWRRTNRTRKPGDDSPVWLEICGGSLVPIPGDDELLARLDEKFPQDLADRMNAITPAAQALGIIGAEAR